MDALVFGHRLRHLRRARGLTLAELGARVGRPASYLSMVETGKREPRLSFVQQVADALDVPVADLLTAEPPNRRAALEIALEKAQADPLYRNLGLPYLRPGSKVPDEALEHILGLYEALRERQREAASTPEAARLANARLRDELRATDYHVADIEDLAAELLADAGYAGAGAVPQGVITAIARRFGFTVEQTSSLPTTVRALADLEGGRIYIPQRDALRTRAARSVVLRTLGHLALGHGEPADFGEFLRQRLYAAYFAAAVLAPASAAVPFLERAKQDRDLSVEDLKEVFYISYEMAAHRFTNLATRYLGIRTHFVRADGQGVIWKAYENDDVPLPRDPQGTIEGNRVCREWGTRAVFSSEAKFAIHYQYTDTPTGTFWCATHVEADRTPHHAITVGVAFDDARWFRGRETELHTVSRCPDGECCRRPPTDLAARWEGKAWPSPRAHSHILVGLPTGTFPGVDLTEVYEFLEKARAGD